MKTDDLSIEFLKEILHYEPASGLFFWRARPGYRVRAGAIAGCAKEDGYVRIQIGRTKRYAQRLAWFYMHGVWPDASVDHINGNTSDNRICNLRLATHAENHQNRKSPNKGSAVQALGVDFKKGMYRARVTLNGKQKHLGYFETVEQASQAYLEAKRTVHPFGTL